MLKIAHLDARVFVARQLNEEDFATLAALGIRAVVANLPDGEAADQLSSQAAEAAARRHGMAFSFMPLTSATITDEDVVAAFAEAMEALPGPILFYCRTGTRSAAVWAQVAAPRLGVSRALELASRAGFDLEDLREEIEEKLASASRTNDSPQPCIAC